VDYSYQAHSGNKLSEEMNAYIKLMATESDQAVAKDGGLTISWDELAARALQAEAFVVKYKDAPERETVQKEYVNKYLTMYINGLINTPIYDTENFKRLDEVKASYKQTVAEAPESVTGRLVAQLLHVLAETGDEAIAVKDGEQAKLASIKQFREGLWAEAEKLLK
jgi:triphosphoribosyl-dephospho-CoA synthetase